MSDSSAAKPSSPAAVSEAAPAPTPDAATVPAPPAAPPTLAKRWANWASNLLVSGVILVVGLVFGREVVQWWRTPAENDPAKVTAGAVTPGSDLLDGPVVRPEDDRSANSGKSGEPSGADVRPVHELAFGDMPYAFRHGSIAGDSAAVVAELRRQCAISADSATLPDGPPAPAERRMLEGLSRLQPTDRRGGTWEVYAIERPLPMAVAVSDKHAANSSSQMGSQPTPDNRRNAVADSRRVLSWAMAFPDMTEGRWTWFTFRPTGSDSQGARPTSGDSDWPAPPEARRSLVIRAEDGAARTAYAGRGSRSSWQSHFDDWTASNGWTATADWLTDGRTSRRAFGNARGDRADVQIGEESNGQLRAIVTVTPG